MKEKVARFGVDYASRKLGLSEIEVAFRPQSFFRNKDINATFLSEGYYIVFSSDWIKDANELEILKCSFHESRHAYQRICIDFPQNINHDPHEVNDWEMEFDEYKYPGSSQYLEQKIEMDAIKFSEKMIDDILKSCIL